MLRVLPNAPLFLMFCIHCIRKSISCTLKIASESAICHLSGPTATALSPLDCHGAAPWISLPPPLPPTLTLCPSARVVQLNMSGPLSPLLRTFQGPHSLTWKTIFLCDTGSLFPLRWDPLLLSLSHSTPATWPSCRQKHPHRLWSLHLYTFLSLCPGWLFPQKPLGSFPCLFKALLSHCPLDEALTQVVSTTVSTPNCPHLHLLSTAFVTCIIYLFIILFYCLSLPPFKTLVPKE